MNKFIRNILILIFTITILITIILLGTIKIYSFISFKIPKEKDVIIIGDSHTECAINDNIFKRSINISQSAEAYFYSYIKLRKFLSVNTQIKKVILSFHGGSIVKSRDNWIKGERYIRSKVPRYLFLFNKEEYSFMIKEKGFLPSVFKFPIYHIKIIIKFIIKKDLFYTDLNIGKYLRLDRDKLIEDKNDEDDDSVKRNEKNNDEYSLYELNNILKIVELCKQYNVELIFLNSPIYASETYGKKTSLANYRKTYFSEIKYLDFSDFNLPLYGYGDRTHLNYKGAEIFSNYLENNFKNIF